MVRSGRILSGWPATRKHLGLRDVDSSRKGETPGFLARKTVCPATDRGRSQKGRFGERSYA